MAKYNFSTSSYLVRLSIAILLIFATFNPVKPFSYFYWAINPLIDDINSFTILKGLVGIILLIGWTIFLRATLRSLGLFGTLLAIAFFGLLLWLIVDQGWIGIDNRDAITWLVLVGLSGVLSAGISWSHIRRRMTGQFDVDETDT
jgi:hypothetical protein